MSEQYVNFWIDSHGRTHADLLDVNTGDLIKYARVPLVIALHMSKQRTLIEESKVTNPRHTFTYTHKLSCIWEWSEKDVCFYLLSRDRKTKIDKATHLATLEELNKRAKWWTERDHTIGGACLNGCPACQ